MNKTILWVTVIVVILVVAGIGGFMALKEGLKHGGAVVPSSNEIQSVEVSDKAINIKGMFQNSYAWYNGYKANYKNGSLYVMLEVGLEGVEGSTGATFNISIPNTYGKIDAIYLTAGNPKSDLLIWPKDYSAQQQEPEGHPLTPVGATTTQQ